MRTSTPDPVPPEQELAEILSTTHRDLVVEEVDAALELVRQLRQGLGGNPPGVVEPVER